jgi:transketolase
MTTKLTMREQMAQSVEETMARDERVMLVLADISRTPLDSIFRRFPDRAINIGIMEQAMVSVAAGMAMEGLIPVAHSITPFLVERPFEQLKDDFCYQRLGGNFISIGSSYDYSVEGMTHHGSGDVPILRSLPGMQVVVPGTAAEFDVLFREAYANDAPTYYRLGLKQNAEDRPVHFGQLDVVRRGKRATVIAVGPMLAPALAAVEDLDVTVLYCTTVAPFDGATLRAASASGDLVLVEPYYSGTLVPDLEAALSHMPVRVLAIGVPHEVLTRYGTPEEHDAALGLTSEGIRGRIDAFLGG